MEIRQRVRDVVIENGWALLKINGVPDRPGVAARIFGAIAEAGIAVDLILQNAGVQRMTDISFTVRQAQLAPAEQTLRSLIAEVGAAGIVAHPDLAKVQLVGTGILSDPAYVGGMFRALADAGVNILAIGTSEIRISCLVAHADKEKAGAALHAAFRVAAPAT